MPIQKEIFFISSMLLALTIITGLAGIGTSANNLVQQDQILKAIQKLSATLTNHTQTLHYILSLTQQEHGSLAQMMMDNHLVFDFLLNEMESSIYRTFLVSSTLTIQDRYRPASPEVSQDIQVMHNILKIFQQIPTISKVISLFLWLLPSTWGQCQE